MQCSDECRFNFEGGIWEIFALCSVSEIISHRGPVCVVDWMTTFDCWPFIEKCGNAVLSFPVCNCHAGIRSHNSPQLSRGFGLLNAPWQDRDCMVFIFCPEIWPQRATSSVWVPSTPPHSWAAAVPPACPPLRPVGRKGGVRVTQSPFLKSHLAAAERNWSD